MGSCRASPNVTHSSFHDLGRSHMCPPYKRGDWSSFQHASMPECGCQMTFLHCSSFVPVEIPYRSLSVVYVSHCVQVAYIVMPLCHPHPTQLSPLPPSIPSVPQLHPLASSESGQATRSTMTSIFSSAYNMLPNMPTWMGGGGASAAVSKPAPTTPRRGWWGRGGAPATDKTTTKTDAVQEKVITPFPTDRTAVNTTKATTRQDTSSPAGTAPTVPPTGKPESGTGPGDTTATRPAASTGWFSRAPKSPPLFRDDRGWISAWPLTSHKAVNKDFSWKDLTSDQVGELYDLHSRYYGTKNPNHWEFASKASKYLHDDEQASKFYRETVFAGGRVPKELVSTPHGLGHLPRCSEHSIASRLRS